MKTRITTGIAWIAMAAMCCAAPEQAKQEDKAERADKKAAQPSVQVLGPAEVPARAAGPGATPQATPMNSEEFTRLIEMIKESSAKIEKIQQKMNARTQVIYDTNPEVKQLYAAMIEKQKHINAIVEADSEYADIRMRRDVLATVIPDEPRHSFPMTPGQGGFQMVPGGSFPMSAPPMGGRAPVFPAAQPPAK